MYENGLLKIEKDVIQPTSQCLTLWLRRMLKWVMKSKCVFTQNFEEDEIRKWDGEQNVREGNKTKDLMKKWEEFKHGKTPFGNWDLMEGIGEEWNTKSLTMSSLFSFEMRLNSLSCLIFSRAANSLLSFSSLAFPRFSYLAFSSSSLLFFSFISFSSCSLLA